MIEVLPWAMLAKGPAWTKAGLPIRVCIRLGMSASFMQDGHGAGDVQVLGGDRLALLVGADDDAAQARRAGPSGRVARARMAMISEATVMS